MHDEGVELSDPAAFLPNGSLSDANLQGSTSVDSIIDEYLKHNCSRTCSHTHSCNPPGPDSEHIHTCFHTHIQVVSSGDDTKTTHSDTPSLKPRRSVGNREAVRKYREKKKAHTAYLEEEVGKLRLLNEELVRKVQRQAVLEAEIVRLRGVLHDLRAKIDVELGSYPFQKDSSFNKEGDCGVQSAGRSGAFELQCQAEILSFQQRDDQSMPAGNGGEASRTVISRNETCQPAVAVCQVNRNGMVGDPETRLEAVETLVSAENQGQ